MKISNEFFKMEDEYWGIKLQLKEKKLKTQGKKPKLKQKTQGFGKFWSNLLRKSTEMTKKQGGNYYNTEIKDEMFKTL